MWSSRSTTGTASTPTWPTLPTKSASAATASLSEAPDFRIGAHYLVTADDAFVPMCGGTTEATDEARAMFREAFETPKK